MIGQTVEVPFTKFDNRRGFTREQLEKDWVAQEFFRRFKGSFEHHADLDIYIFIEPDFEKIENRK